MKVGLLASTGKHLDSFFPEIYEEMKGQGLEVFPASGTPTRKMPFDRIRGMSQSPTPANIIAPSSLRRWVTDRGLDVVVTNTATASALVRVAALRIPVVYFCHGLHWNTGKLPAERLWRLLERHWLDRTDGVITINTDDERWFSENATETVVLRHFPTGVGVPRAYSDGAIEVQAVPPVRLLWVGDFSSRKRPDLAVEVASRLTSLGLGFVLTMLGDGPLMDATQELIDKRGLNRVVSLAGRVASTAAYIDAAHVLVHTAKWEGLPRVLLEGAARCRRAVAFDVKGVRDIPEAKLVRDGNVDAMADAIYQASKNGGAQFVMDPVVIESSPEVAHRIIDVLRSVLAKKV